MKLKHFKVKLKLVGSKNLSYFYGNCVSEIA